MSKEADFRPTSSDLIADYQLAMTAMDDRRHALRMALKAILELPGLPADAHEIADRAIAADKLAPRI